MPLQGRSILFLLALVAAAAQAHDAWIEPRDGKLLVLFGHDDKIEPVVPAKVKSIMAINSDGTTSPAQLATAGKNQSVAVTGKPVMLTLHYDNGYWTKTTSGSKNAPKNEVPDAISASHVVKLAKTILSWSAAVTKPLGQQLEIVPLATTAPAAGGSLTVQVLWEGKPLAGAKVARAEYGNEKPIETDADGKASVPVVAGRQMIATSYKKDLTGDTRADSYSVSANLGFEAR